MGFANSQDVGKKGFWRSGEESSKQEVLQILTTLHFFFYPHSYTSLLKKLPWQGESESIFVFRVIRGQTMKQTFKLRVVLLPQALYFVPDLSDIGQFIVMLKSIKSLVTLFCFTEP